MHIKTQSGADPLQPVSSTLTTNAIGANRGGGAPPCSRNIRYRSLEHVDEGAVSVEVVAHVRVMHEEVEQVAVVLEEVTKRWMIVEEVEERVDGRQYEMDVQLVHRSADGHVAVIAVLLDTGAAQPVIQSVWNNLPLEKYDPLRADSPLDPARLLPGDRRYYTYMGSLTTPPCDEGVLWMVMQQPVTVSAQQVSIFGHLYPMNARPVQQADGRLIKQSN